jgi:DNA-binding NtrC family response regulator
VGSHGDVTAYKLLVVDDEPDIASTLAKGLSQKGHQVDAFSDCMIALSKFRPNYYDLSIIDIRMPGMNGFELYRRLKAKDPNLKVAFMTAFEIYRNEFEKVLPKYDVRTFITKPVTINRLDSIIREALKIKQP